MGIARMGKWRMDMGILALWIARATSFHCKNKGYIASHKRRVKTYEASIG